MNHIIRPKLWPLLIFLITVALMRIINSTQLTPWANFSPIGAMALFSGAYFRPKWLAFTFPLLTLFISDLFIQKFVFQGKYGIIYDGWYFIYAAFVGISLVGFLLSKKVTLKRFVLAGFTGSLIHWAIADFFVWFMGGMDLRTMQPLTRDLAGIVQCYVQGFSFFRNFLLGTLVYGGIMFGLYEWMKVRFSKKIFSTVTVK
jgi:hypothetical protein